MITLQENERRCPVCGQIIQYKNKYVARRNEKLKTRCMKCYGKYRSLTFIGEKNPAFGTKLSAERKADIAAFGKNRIRSDEELKRCKETIKLASDKRRGGKNNYCLWVEKYGKDEADRRDALLKKKQSRNSSGENNPMFGRPAPQGSGNGWKCRYKNIYFRSLRELSFFLEQLDGRGIEWSSGESRKFSIKYISPTGVKRNYFPDYVIGDIMYECKPRKLWDTPLIQAKTAAARQYCKKNGMEYVLIDIEPNPERIKGLLLDGSLSFDEERYKLKFLKYFDL